jgi:hypothetical protein
VSLIRVDYAAGLARHILASELPQRWLHVQGVAERASVLEPVFDRERADLLVASAYLHDVGYASALRVTGFHPLDGAIWLRSLGLDERIVGLVAHHSCSCIEACFHQLDGRLACEFPRDDALPHDALLYCDLTTGPAGQPLSFEERLADIRCRYGPDHLVVQFLDRAEPEMRAAVARVEAILASQLLPV